MESHIGEQEVKSPINIYFSPFRLLVIIMFSIFVTEAIIMFLFSILPRLSQHVQIVVDGLLLTVLVFPIVYLFMLRPLVLHITERKRAEAEREKLILELKETLSKLKQLSGLLPICASCKKIRDDKGYWNQIESYISDHSEADFTHGICPECMKNLYGISLEEDTDSKKR